MTDATAIHGTGGTDARQAGDGIVTVTDRTSALHAAKRHTRFVNAMRLFLPAACFGVAALYAASAMNSKDWDGSIVDLDPRKVLPENLAMNNPTYRGFNKDGGSYFITAKTAKQDFSKPRQVTLNTITGELVDAKKMKTVLEATRGTFDTKSNHLELFDGITITSQDGMSAKLKTASIKTKKKLITSNDPVQVEMATGSIKSNRLQIRQQTREVSFLDDVVARLRPQKKKPEVTAAGQAAGRKQNANGANPFGASDQPVDVYAKRLDVFDDKKIAVFAGNVRAVQGETTLVTRELEIAYKNEEKPSDGRKPEGKNKSSSGASQVDKITAKYPVMIKRGAEQQVTSQSAVFDAKQQTALLSQNVVLSSGQDRRATADQALLNSKDGSAVLSGNVVVIQGRNRLNGRHLFVDQAKGIAKLTAPPAGGSGPGRITARLYSNDGAKGSDKAGTDTKPTKAPKKKTLGAAFATDPKAPVDIEADSLDVDDKQSSAVFVGGVVARQGSFTMRSTKLTAHYVGGSGLGDPLAAKKGKSENTTAQLKEIRADGKVVITSTNAHKAEGDWAKFDAKTNTVEVGGDVRLSQGKTVVRGTRILINMNSGEATIVSDKNVAGGGWSSILETQVESAKKKGKGKGKTQLRPIQMPDGRASAVFYPQELKNSAKTQRSKSGAQTPGSKQAAPAEGSNAARARQPSASSWESFTTTGGQSN